MCATLLVASLFGSAGLATMVVQSHGHTGKWE